MTQTVTIEDTRAELARKDFAYYCSYIHNRPLYRHQQEWAREWRREGAQTLITAPPETFKTSTIRPFLEWTIGNSQDVSILYIMNTASQATKQVMSISETIEYNPRYRQVFPWIEPDKARGWSHEAIFVKRENKTIPDPTLYGTGIDGPYQGAHVDLLVVDDPTDQQDVRSQTTMEQQRERLRGVLIDRLKQGGRFLSILTRWGESDLLPIFREMGFLIIENPIEGRYPWGRLLCPEVYSDEVLMEKRESKGGAMYMLTFMCDPSAASGSIIKREFWRYYTEAPRFEQKPVHSWDLSLGKNALSDYSAFGSWSVGENGYYLTNAGRWQLDMEGRVKKMLLLAEQERPRKVLIEESSVTADIIEYIRKYTRLPIQTFKPGTKDKVSRVQQALPYIEAGRVWLPANQPWVDAFVDECAGFPGGQYDDQVDQMSQALITLAQAGYSSGGMEPVMVPPSF